MSEKYAVILVDSTSQAMRIEKILIQAGIASKMIPVPRHLSSDCGVCLRIDQKNVVDVEIILANQHDFFRSIEVVSDGK